MKIINTILLTLIFSISGLSQTLEDKWITVNKDGCQVLDPYYSEGSSCTWDGGCQNGKANGFGKLLKYQNGEYESTFEGEYKNGIREGKGKFTHKDGTVREGLFENGQMIGKGTMISEDGQKYVGDFINYRMHGYGTATFPNGAHFEGFVVADNFYTGVYTDYDGTKTYIQQGYPVSKISEEKSNYEPKLGIRVTEYFDENWKRCKQKDASYYRMVTYKSPNKPEGIIKDYYISGQIQSDFTAVYLDYDDEGKNFHEGEATWYHKNGKIEQKRYYMNNKINGKNTFYYDNGQVASEANYNHGVLNGEWKQWYKTGNLKLVAYFENGTLLENKYIEYDENGIGAIVYNENFYLNKSNWEANYEGSKSAVNNDNQLEFNVSSDNIIGRWSYISLDQNSDYSIESIVQKKNGKDNIGYGILFGFKDLDNYFQFLVSGNGMFMINSMFEGINMEISKWTSSDYINKGSARNQLKVIKIDDTFVFSINGQVVKREESSILRGNNYGMLVGGKGDFILENITVKEFVSNEEIANRTPKAKTAIESEWKGNGTGFFIDKNGYIATNYHVVENAKEIEVEYIRNGVKQTFSAEVIQSDKQNDISIIKIKSNSFQPFSNIPYNFKTQISDVGSNVFALGYPMALSLMGTEIKFTDGKISSKTGMQGDITTYQISVPIQPGNSGGPLFDYDGNLVGITSSGVNRELDITENVNYAIKTSYLRNLVDVLPYQLTMPNDKAILSKTLTEKIKVLSDYVVLIKIR